MQHLFFSCCLFKYLAHFEAPGFREVVLLILPKEMSIHGYWEGGKDEKLSSLLKHVLLSTLIITEVCMAKYQHLKCPYYERIQILKETEWFPQQSSADVGDIEDHQGNSSWIWQQWWSTWTPVIHHETLAKDCYWAEYLTDSGNFYLIPHTNGTVLTESYVAIQKQNKSGRICGNYKELYQHGSYESSVTFDLRYGTMLCW